MQRIEIAQLCLEQVLSRCEAALWRLVSFSTQDQAMRSRRPVVGVDLDGVLGNQVSGVLQRENARLGLNLTYEQIIHWDLPFGDTSFRPSIGRAMEDPDYVLQMPVHDGAPEMLTQLKERFFVKIVTVRPVEAIAWTEDWLAANALAYDELVPAKEALKSRHGADALVDDYAGNIAEFLGHSGGIAILVDQRWNQNVDELAPWLDGMRLRRLASLGDVAAYLEAAIG